MATAAPAFVVPLDRVRGPDGEGIGVGETDGRCGLNMLELSLIPTRFIDQTAKSKSNSVPLTIKSQLVPMVVHSAITWFVPRAIALAT